MYGIINKCYGISIREMGGGIDSQKISLLREIARMDSGDEVNGWDDAEVTEWASECLDSYTFGWSSYSGSGDSPLAIGFEISQWAYWDLGGENGIIAAAKQEATPQMIEKWNGIVDEKLSNLIQSHGFTPGIFWTASTS